MKKDSATNHPPSSEAIKRLRKRLGWTAATLAAQLGYTNPYAFQMVYKWEAGERKPNPAAAKILKELMDNGKQS